MKTDADDLPETEKQQATPQPVKLHKAVSTRALRQLLLVILIVAVAFIIIVVAAALALGSFAP